MHFFAIAVFQLLLLCLSTWALGVYSTEYTQEKIVNEFFNNDGSSSRSVHTNNWAVLVCSSRYWFNYRHVANTLGMYRTVKRSGIPDSNIILMLADDLSCNLRDNFPGSIYANASRDLDLYGDNIEVDYRGYEVTVENFIRVLTDRIEPSVPRSKRLLTNERSNIIVYTSGYGGNEFLKFQDNEELSAVDIANTFEQMHQNKRYNKILFMVDGSSQANTMHSKLYSPNIFTVSSSDLSYSHENDNDRVVAVSDDFSHYVLEFIEKTNERSLVSRQELVGKNKYISLDDCCLPPLSAPRPNAMMIEEVVRESHRLVLLPPPSSYAMVMAGLFAWLRKWRVARICVSIGLLLALVNWAMYEYIV